MLCTDPSKRLMLKDLLASPIFKMVDFTIPTPIESYDEDFEQETSEEYEDDFDSCSDEDEYDDQII